MVVEFKKAIDVETTEFEPLTVKPLGQKVGYLGDNNGFLIKNYTPIKSEYKLG